MFERRKASDRLGAVLVHTGTKLRSQDSTRFKQDWTRPILLRVT